VVENIFQIDISAAEIVPSASDIFQSEPLQTTLSFPQSPLRLGVDSDFDLES
jgi:hypothetical protein